MGKSKFDRETWDKIRDGFIAGIPSRDLQEMFGPTPEAIRKRAEREKWPTPARITKMRREFGLENHVSGKHVDDLARAMAELETEKILRHRALVARMAHEKLKQSTLAPPKNWRDAEIADKMARRALGLEDGPQQQTLINLGVLGGSGSFGVDDAVVVEDT